MEDDWTFVFGSGYSYADTLRQRIKTPANTKTKSAASKPTKNPTSRKQKIPRRLGKHNYASKSSVDHGSRRRKAFRSRRRLVYDNESDFTSHYDAANYELAGRDIANTFFDLRSGAKARHRHKDRLDRYWSFRAVNSGQPDFDCPLQESHTVKMTKQTLHQEAQNWPRPPKNHHRHSDKNRDILSPRRALRIKNKKHARNDQQDYHENEFDSTYQYYTTGDSSLFWRNREIEYERENFREEDSPFLSSWPGCGEDLRGGSGEHEGWRWRWCAKCGELEVQMKACPVWDEVALNAFVAPTAFHKELNAERSCGIACYSVESDVTCELEELVEMFLGARFDDAEQSDDASEWEMV
ncbi:hypothetical protein LTR78_003632 [Recurvomyces mirabilis]|uniref:Uncharacterized protein n=1 Tax=Recurvomyces mirabilis TaxID=574656 RepID=A0AAE0WR94_9PEZI|nr:hypothetical protein LTR78_003632 [Recurvomyces mirabilis]KAK5154746.1 hypothetical protein LTS14_006325 [Recurvomyces mirabilis]